MGNQVYPSLQYQVQESIYDAKTLLDEQNFYHQRQGAPSELTKEHYNFLYRLLHFMQFGLVYYNYYSPLFHPH